MTLTFLSSLFEPLRLRKNSSLIIIRRQVGHSVISIRGLFWLNVVHGLLIRCMLSVDRGVLWVTRRINSRQQQHEVSLRRLGKGGPGSRRAFVSSQVGRVRFGISGKVQLMIVATLESKNMSLHAAGTFDRTESVDPCK